MGLNSQNIDLVRMALFGGMALGGSRSRAGERRDPPGAQPPPAAKPVVRRNGPCPCGSGRKFKKCCGAPRQHPRPKPQMQPRVVGAQVEAVARDTQPPSNKQVTAMAMLNAGVRKQFVWAFLETGLFITELNRNSHKAEDLERWDKALREWEALPPEQQEIYLVEEAKAPAES